LYILGFNQQVICDVTHQDFGSGW